MKSIEEIADAVERFQTANDDKLAEVDRLGEATVNLETHVDKLNERIDEVSDKLAEERKAREAIELAAQRPRVSPEVQERYVDQATKFLAMRGQRDVTDADVENIRAYVPAFANYLRTGDIKNELSVGSNPDGGYWVDPDTSGQMATLLQETSPIRSIANVVTITTDALEGFNDLDTATSNWVDEKGARNETDTPTIGRWRIPVWEQYAMPEATQTVLNDAAFGVESWLAMKVADIFARTENTAFVTGTGSGQPRGFMTHTDGAPTATAWNQIEQIPSGHASLLTDDGLIDLVFSLKPAYRANARFVFNRQTQRDIRKLKDGNSAYMWQPDFTQQGQAMLLGYPITEAEDVADIGAGNLPIAFGDFRQAYTIVDRQGITVLRDPFTNKPMVRFYSTKRTGGDVVNYEALKIQDVAAS